VGGFGPLLVFKGYFMALSGSTDFSLNRDEIITRALQRVGIVEVGESPDSDQTTHASDELNVMVKSWQNFNIFLWKVEWIQKTFTASSEVTGTDGNIYTCQRSHTSAANNKPVTGADYTSYWTQTGSTGGVWATSTAYSSVGDFQPASDVIAIDRMFLRDTGDDTKIDLINSARYFDIVDKDDDGTPQAAWFDFKIAGASTVYLTPQPDDTDTVVHYRAYKKLNDFDDASDDADFPARWLEALIAGLASKLARVYKAPIEDIQDLRREAVGQLRLARKDNREKDEKRTIQSAY
jgi:hypothetical protein